MYCYLMKEETMTKELTSLAQEVFESLEHYNIHKNLAVSALNLELARKVEKLEKQLDKVN